MGKKTFTIKSMAYRGFLVDMVLACEPNGSTDFEIEEIEKVIDQDGDEISPATVTNLVPTFFEDCLQDNIGYVMQIFAEYCKADGLGDPYDPYKLAGVSPKDFF